MTIDENDKTFGTTPVLKKPFKRLAPADMEHLRQAACPHLKVVRRSLTMLLCWRQRAHE